MSPLQTLILRIYAGLLRLYPAEFYAQFADEMAATFALRLQERSRPTLLVGLWEIASLLVAIFRERQQAGYDLGAISPRQTILVLLLPVLAGCAVLFFRSVTIFYLSDKVWAVFGGISIVVVGIGWLQGRGLTALALPILGFMLNVALWHLMTSAVAYSIRTEIQIAVPAIALVAVLVVYSVRHTTFTWRSWLPYILALPVTGLVISIAVIALQGGVDVRSLSLRQIYHGYVLGALLPAGSLALLILAGMPFARRFGARAVLLMIGYLFFDLLGLSASLPYDIPQRVTGGAYVLTFLLVIPLLMLRASDRRRARLSVLIPVALAYGALFLVKALFGETDPTFTLYRTNELIQTLIALVLAMELYAHLQRKEKPKDSPVEESSLETASI